MKDPDIKHIYLIGNDTYGFHSYTTSKEVAKEFVKQRKDKYKIKKVKYTDKLYENLSCNEEIVTHDGHILMSAIEEEHLFESFAQWESDILLFIDEFILYNKYIRYTEEEKPNIKELTKFLKDYKLYVNEIYNYDGDSDLELYDRSAVAKWFIKHVCEGFQK